MQALVISAALVVALSVRRQLGLTAVYLVVGALQSLQTVAAVSVRVPLFDGFSVNPGSSVIFTGTLLALLLVYVLEDAAEAKRIIYGLLISSSAVGFLLILLNLQRDWAGLGADSSLARAGSNLLFGSFVTWADAIVLILAFDVTTRLGVRFPALRAFMSLSIAVALDAALISWYVFDEGRSTAFLTNASGKLASALVYTGTFSFVLRRRSDLHFEGDRLSFADLFQALTWRDRYEALEQRAVRDGLTGVFNRAYFDRETQIQAHRAALRGGSFALLLLDLDDFKKVNDTYGHAAGDRVLQEFGAALKSVARQNDTVCRYGGEEFAVLVAGRGDNLVQGLFDRFSEEFHARLAAASPPLPGDPPTFSLGAAQFPDDGTTIADVLAAADRRLYRAKRAGKNRAIAEDQPPG